MALAGPFVVGALLVLALSSPSQGRVTRVALDTSGSTGYPSLNFGYLSVDGAGNAYVMGAGGSSFQDAAYKLTPDGGVRVIIDESGDGGANPLDCPLLTCWLTADEAGNVYVVDEMPTPLVFRVTAAGVVSKILDATGDGAGNPLVGFPYVTPGLAGDAYVAGRDSDNVLHVDAAGTVSPVMDAAGDGAGHVLDHPRWPAVASDGTVYVSGLASDNVFAVAPGGAITQVLDASGDGLGHVLDAPGQPLVDADGNVFVVGLESRNVFRIAPGGAVTQILDATGDGLGNQVVLPQNTAVDAVGNFYLSSFDYVTERASLFRVAPGGTITQVLDETGDGQGHAALQIAGLATDDAGNVYAGGFRDFTGVPPSVFRITPSGAITPVLDVLSDGSGNDLIRLGSIAMSGAELWVLGAREEPFPYQSALLHVHFGCEPTPRTDCRQPAVPGVASLKVKNSPVASKDLVTLKWVRGEATDVQAFGDPTTTDAYDLCVYDEAGVPATLLFDSTAPAGGTCGDKPCWRPLGDDGFRYVGGTGTRVALRRLVLKAGVEGTAKIVASGRGRLLLPMTLPLVPPITVQVQRAGGDCWSARFELAGVTANDSLLFEGVAN